MSKNIDMIKKLNFVKDGVTKLPPGFRFQPTEEELVFQYLKCKVFSFPLPASIIPEINVFKYNPWDLPGDVEGEKFFFCKKEAKYHNGNRINRDTNSGYWKTSGSDKQIVSARSNPMIGMKKTLVFYKGDPPKGSKTDWIMHEYRLACERTASCNWSLYENSSTWVLCRVSLRKKSSADNFLENRSICDNYSSTVSLCISPSFSSSSSVVTEISLCGSDNEETGDSYSSYYFEREGLQ